ncbi:MAG: cell envelope integrity protein CreD [Undibacterium sp.]|nr:cell envelope integrity protein CreD [Undibacterium sp.]
MQKTLFFKALIIGALMCLIAIPLSMIENTIRSRIHFRDEAVRSIAEDSVGAQTLLGPLLVIPYNEHYEEEEVVDKQSKRSIVHQKILSRNLFVFPNELKISAQIDTDQRHRGIHKVLVYSGQHQLSGDFELPLLNSIVHEKTASQITLGTPYISLGLSDTRGLKNIPKINWEGTEFEFAQNSQLDQFQQGLHANLMAMDLKNAKTVKFNLNLSIDGIEQLAFVPLAKNTQVSLTSKWQHPQFFGRFLPSPKGRTIDANGFNVTWNISSLASNAQQQIFNTECCKNNPTTPPDGVMSAAQPARSNGQIDSFGVAFIEPINIYSQSDRAVKYGLLFVALTFAAFFIFEILKCLPIHPVQYTLVGLALVIFFLLLVSLSEKMSFILAYFCASLACISLIAFYLSHVLKSWKRGLGFSTALTILYGVLFGLLQSENNALVMGSILLFTVLAAIMLVTRKVDWYQLGKRAEVTSGTNGTIGTNGTNG